MYGADAVEAASAALSGEAPFYGLQAVDSDLQAFPAHQSLLKAYEKLQRAKAAFLGKISPACAIVNAYNGALSGSVI
ncbi:hypothetical protein [Klebsiella pneumoniae IS53]|nr:hypothetical protein [Klebsiella pneumoniae IS53]